MKAKTGWMPITLVAAGLVAALTASPVVGADPDAGKTAATPAPNPALAVNLVSPQTVDWPRMIAASGGLFAWQEGVIAAGTGGLRVMAVAVDVGDKVHLGQVLAVLDQDTVQAELDQQEARVAQVRAALAEARANGDRARNVKDKGAMSEQQITQYLIAEEAAKANLAAAEAARDMERIRLNQTQVLAVDDGVISSRGATLGTVVQVGTELFRLVRQGRVEWRAEVTAEQLAQIQPGQEAHLRLPGGETVTGTVRMPSPTLDPITRYGLVYVDLPIGGPARPGMFAQGQIRVGASQALTLPESAVVLRDGSSFVFEIQAEDRVAQRKVETGRRGEGRVEILSGLDTAARIVATGGAFLNDGDRVRVEAPSATPDAPAPPEQGVAREHRSMNVSAWSIRHPVPAILLFGFLTIIGLMSFHALGIQNFPDVELPTITVTASLEGADPSQLETEVARKIEDKIASLGGIEHIRTTLSDGSATIRVEFQIEKNTEVALNEVRNAVDSVRADLPQDMTDPVVSKVTTSGSPIVTYTVASERMDEQALSWFVDNEVAKALLAVKGVGQVARVGGVDREVHVDLDSARMQALGVTAEAISAQLKRVQQDASGGRGDIGGAVQSVRSLGAVDTVGDIAELIIPLPDGRRVRLGDLGTVSDSFAERSSSALLDGAPMVAFEVTRIRGASEVAVAQAVQAAVARLENLHPHVRIQEAFNLVDPVLDNFRGSMELLYEGALLAILVVFWFLRDWRATLIAAVALPLSIIPTFAAMLWLGFSLNILTLLALALVVGILVDDAIVEIENIVRHLRMGKPPFQAAMEAADEIGLAVIATTLTLVAVFLPTAFMGGVPGKFFVQFGITAAVSVVASLMVARLLTPMMAAYFLKAHPEGNHDSLIMTGYLASARWCLDHRKTTALAAILFFIGSMQLLPLLPKGFVPAADRGLTSIKLELPPGSSLDDTQLAAERARDLIAPMEEILGIFTAVGSTSGQGPMAMGGAKDVRLATLTLRLVHRHDRDRTQAQVERELRERLGALTGVRVAVGAAQSGEKVQISLASDDPIALAAAAKAVERDLRTLQGVGNVTSGASLQRPEIQIRPDFARAADLGVTTSALAGAVRVATSGDFKVNLPKLNLPQRQIPIRVRLDRALRTDLDAIAQLRVPAKVGSVPLSAVASLSMGSGPAQIDRVDRMRNVSIDVELGGRQLGAVLAEANALPALQDLPPTVSRVEQGDAQRMAELFASFGTAMLIGVLCIYAVLVLLFHDFMQPFSILAALPLSLGGAFLALLLTGNSFSMPSIIGVLMLMGIVTKNSILLVEYAIVARREHGMERRPAILDACHKRARPIVMTTIAMGAGMLPVALGLGAEPSFRAPMAIAVIGGLITSTFLSLLVIPVVFTYVDDLLRLLKRLVPRGHGAHHPREPGNPVSSGP